jgi:Bacterial membrane protein YfhO
VRALVPAALVLLCAQRALEMRNVYPTLPARALAPPLPGLEAISGAEPARIVAAGTIFRPNGAALYRLEDVRGYESLVLDRFADTYPLWCRAQPASFNLVTRLESPFLSFLNARFAIGAPGDRVPEGWRERTRTAAMTVFENPSALPRAFVPRMLRYGGDPARRLGEMAGETDFSRTAWLSESGRDEANGEAALELRAVGPDLHVSADVSRRALLATSLPDWPGWRADAGGRALALTTVNHTFVGLWLPPGKHEVRLRYRPASFSLGLLALAAGAVCAALLAATARRRTS